MIVLVLHVQLVARVHWRVAGQLVHSHEEEDEDGVEDDDPAHHVLRGGITGWAAAVGGAMMRTHDRGRNMNARWKDVKEKEEEGGCEGERAGGRM
jgi:hypothetical protein